MVPQSAQDVYLFIYFLFPSYICSVLYEILAPGDMWSQILLNSYCRYVARRLSHTIVHSPSLGSVLVQLVK